MWLKITNGDIARYREMRSRRPKGNSPHGRPAFGLRQQRRYRDKRLRRPKGNFPHGRRNNDDAFGQQLPSQETTARKVTTISRNAIKITILRKTISNDGLQGMLPMRETASGHQRQRLRACSLHGRRLLGTNDGRKAQSKPGKRRHQRF